jgi:glucose-6-phosphate dehydrogenase assembly protein OpcA
MSNAQPDTTTGAALVPQQEPVAVPLRDVERELSRQTKVVQGLDESPVLRARMSNLVIFCSRKDRAANVAAQIPGIVTVHPARVLLLIGEPGPDNVDISATVHAESLRLEGRRHACAELVTLHAAGASVDRLPFAVRALQIGDLPTNLWWACPQPPPLAGPLLYDLSEYAQQIVYDSLGWSDPVRGMAGTASWLNQVERGDGSGRWRVASDLNWRRLKYWRRVVAQALDPGSAPGAAESITEILVEHGPHAVAQGWELASWMVQRAGWRIHGAKVQMGVEMSWRSTTPHGEARLRIKRLEQGPPEIRRVRIVCTIGNQPITLNLVVEDEMRLAIHLEGKESAARTMNVPPLSPAELIGRQLSDRERDPVFRESMAVAQVMAQSVLG